MRVLCLRSCIPLWLSLDTAAFVFVRRVWRIANGRAPKAQCQATRTSHARSCETLKCLALARRRDEAHGKRSLRSTSSPKSADPSCLSRRWAANGSPDRANIADVHVQLDKSVSMEQELSESFMKYAMSTILGRALPDARDGLKPVHRRILYAMRELRLMPGSQYRKCARVVGEVLGKFHPHGDAAVYDALVRMAQDFVMSTPLIEGHGNFGSVDSDPPAAMRYTECRLTRFAAESLLNRYDVGSRADDEILHGGICVDLHESFDGSEREPRVLPARIPLLLVNGASGIAVGMATNVPPHNLGEVCDAVLIVANAARSDALGRELGLTTAETALCFRSCHVNDEVAAVLPAPDFPTGGVIMGLQGAASLYARGHGSVVVRGRTHTERTGKRNVIVATELPYMVGKAELLSKTAELINTRKLEGITDVRDESGRDGLRVVYELKRDAKPEIVQNALFKLTRLQTSIAGNLVAVDCDPTTRTRSPVRLTLRYALDCWLQFRFECCRNRAAYNERKRAARLEVVAGLLVAMRDADAIINCAQHASTPDDARHVLYTTFRLTKPQADAVLALSLSRLTGSEVLKLEDEERRLMTELTRLRNVVANDSAVYDEIISEVRAIKVNHATPRRTMIQFNDESATVREEDLIENARSAVVVGRNGYVKRIPLAEFASQSRGGRGRTALVAGDVIEHVVTCHDHDTLLCIADSGVAYGMRAFHVPESSRNARGSLLENVLPSLRTSVPGDALTIQGPTSKRLRGLVATSGIGTSEQIVHQVPSPATDSTTDSSNKASITRAVNHTPIALNPSGTQDSSDEFLVLLTKAGLLKKTPLQAFVGLSARGLIAITLNDNDKLGWAKLCTNKDSILISSKFGNVVKFPASDIRASSRRTRGVKAMTLRAGDRIVAMDVASQLKRHDHALLVTENGYGKRVKLNAFKHTKRGGAGVVAYKFKHPNDTLASVCCCKDSDEVMISTHKGLILRLPAGSISIQRRTATGVLVQRHTHDKPQSHSTMTPVNAAADRVADVTIVPPDILTTGSDTW